jgi:SAM-dependent methyltransferase
VISIRFSVLATALLLLHLSPGWADAGPKNSGYGGDHATSQRRFDAIAKWQARFEDPARDAWQLPDRVVKALVDNPDLVIADVGSATGYFSVRFARAVPEGQVIGADIEPGMVTNLNDRARSEGLDNLVSVLAGPAGPHLPRPANLIFFCDTVHHIDDRIDYFDRLKQSLLPGGRVAIVDFQLDSDRGPRHKLAPGQVKKEMRQAGYTLAADLDFLPDQYFLVFEPDPENGPLPHAERPGR